MKLRTRITLLTCILLTCILILVDFSVYILFIKIASRNETEQLASKWSQIVEKTGAESVMMHTSDVQLQSEVTRDTIVRIFDLNAALKYEISSNETDFSLKGIQFNIDRTSQLTEVNDVKVLIVHLPILSQGGGIIGFMEIAEKWESLETNTHILVTILIISTVGAVLFSFLGGTFLANTVLRPISKSIQTMREIESSLTFKKIPFQGNANDELYKLTETFNRMMERLEESFFSQQQFVSDASHELNTTLTIIEGYANMLRRWGAQDQEIQKEAVDSIYEETQRMRIMTQQLLNLASSEQGGQLNLEFIELGACCKQVIAHLKHVNTQNIVLYTQNEEIWLYADTMKIKQLLLILLDNALKYSSQTIEVDLSQQKTKVNIRVKDYGIGIPTQDVKHVFERFYRVDSSRHRKTGGTGLGLPIAKSIVAEHRGTILIKSEEGIGTEVIVSIPSER